jgi:hypothetical protein
MGAIKEPVATLYETDFAAWAFEQAEAIRRKDLGAIDVPNLVEELESMGKQQRAELVSRLVILLMHLAKWAHQPAQRTAHSASWQASIDVQRIEIARHVRKNPSLKPYITEAMADAWETARIQAAAETGLARQLFPAQCPYTWDDAMQTDWLPS